MKLLLSLKRSENKKPKWTQLKALHDHYLWKSDHIYTDAYA